MAAAGGRHLVQAVQVHAVEVLLGPLVVRVHLVAGLRAVLGLQLLPGEAARGGLGRRDHWWVFVLVFLFFV